MLRELHIPSQSSSRSRRPAMSCPRPWGPLAFGGGVCKCLKMGRRERARAERGPGMGGTEIIETVRLCLTAECGQTLPDFLAIAEKRLLVKERSDHV